MSRFAPIITMAELQSKLQPYLDGNDDDDFPYNLPESVFKDFKITFNFENCAYEENDGFLNYPCGFETLENGLPVLFVNAGGDWECPVCFCIYWDEKKLRAYIPTDGNIFNKKEKCAYGSEDEPDEIDYENISKICDVNAIKKDIMNRIQIK